MRWRSIVGAYLAGVGVNSIVPARGGDVMKVYLAHRSMPKAAYTTITSSLLAETLVDVVIGPALLIAAYLTGRIPHLPALGHLAAFEWSFFASHARWFMLAVAVEPDPARRVLHLRRAARGRRSGIACGSVSRS